MEVFHKLDAHCVTNWTLLAILTIYFLLSTMLHTPHRRTYTRMEYIRGSSFGQFHTNLNDQGSVNLVEHQSELAMHQETLFYFGQGSILSVGVDTGKILYCLICQIVPLKVKTLESTS